MALDVFPYNADRTRSMTYDREQYESTPYTGDPKILSRGNFKRGFSLMFRTRTQVEFDAAAAFIAAHPFATHFTFRDYRFYPARDFEVWYIPGTFREQGSDVSFRFTYAFDVAQTS